MQLTPAQAMELWHRVMVDQLNRNLPDLSARQLALLLHVYLGEPPHTVRGLAAELNMSKPAVSRALDRLSQLGYLKRKLDAADRRSVLVKRTVAGAVFLRDYADLVKRQARGI